MVDNKDLTVNFLPSPTWNRLGVNRAKIRNIPVDGWNSIPVQKEIIENIQIFQIQKSGIHLQIFRRVWARRLTKSQKYHSLKNQNIG